MSGTTDAPYRNAVKGAVTLWHRVPRGKSSVDDVKPRILRGVFAE